jgi:hypothetical protein
VLFVSIFDHDRFAVFDLFALASCHLAFLCDFANADDTDF